MSGAALARAEKIALGGDARARRMRALVMNFHSERDEYHESLVQLARLCRDRNMKCAAIRRTRRALERGAASLAPVETVAAGAIRFEAAATLKRPEHGQKVRLECALGPALPIGTEGWVVSRRIGNALVLHPGGDDTQIFVVFNGEGITRAVPVAWLGAVERG